MNDLSELVKDCEPLGEVQPPKFHALERMKELQELGLEYVAGQMRDKILLQEKLECISKEKYPVITSKKIQAFLDRTADRQNQETRKTITGPSQLQNLRQHIQGLSSSLFQRGNMLYEQGNQTWTGALSSPPSFLDSPVESRLLGGRLLYAPTHNFLQPMNDQVTGFMWTETKINEYKTIPPDHALKALKTALDKEIFDYFTIASVTKVKDPLLLGRLNGTEDRYFLAQWGEDVSLDDVI